MFRRKESASKKLPGLPCPYCEFENDLAASECKQCYYQLNVSARMQPVSEVTTPDNEILDILLSNELDLEEDAAPTVEAVLSIDDVVVDVDQYSIVEHDDETTEDFTFLPAQGPTLTETIESTPPVEANLSEKDAPTKPVEFKLDVVDPLGEVPEPIHTGRGQLFTPEDSEPVDQDLTEIMQPPVQPRVEETMNVPATPQSTEMTSPPFELPDFDDIDIGDSTVDSFESTDKIVREDKEKSSTEGTQIDEIAEPNSDQNVEQPIEDQPDLTESESTQKPSAPLRIWPWPAQEPWEDAVVIQEVVDIMSKIQHGKLEEATYLLDVLGPHLSVNLDVVHHICVALQYINRKEHSVWIAQMAVREYPDHASIPELQRQILGGAQ